MPQRHSEHSQTTSTFVFLSGFTEPHRVESLYRIKRWLTRYAAKYWIHRGGVVRFLRQSSREQLLCAVLILVKADWIHHNLMAGCSVMTNLTFSSHKVDHTWPPSEMGCAFPMIWQRDETQYGKKSRLLVSTLSAVKPLPTYGKPMN